MNAIPPFLDHLVLATRDLAATLAEFTRRTGVEPAPGGVHVGRGTRNHLVALGGSSYLEIIGPDPEQAAPGRPRPFASLGLTTARTLNWAIAPPDLDAAIAAARAQGYDPGPAKPMSRRRPDGTLLRWRLTDGEDADPSGLVPFLIDWGDSPHPTAAGLPLTPLLSMSGSAPDPEAVRRPVRSLGTDLALTVGPVGLSFTLDTPKGPVTFH